VPVDLADLAVGPAELCERGEALLAAATRALTPEELIEDHVRPAGAVVAAVFEAVERAGVTSRSGADTAGEMAAHLPPESGLADQEERTRIAPQRARTPLPGSAMATLVGRTVVQASPGVQPGAWKRDGRSRRWRSGQVGKPWIVGLKPTEELRNSLPFST